MSLFGVERSRSRDALDRTAMTRDARGRRPGLKVRRWRRSRWTSRRVVRRTCDPNACAVRDVGCASDGEYESGK